MIYNNPKRKGSAYRCGSGFLMLTGLAWVLSMQTACALELDTLIPAEVPGYADGFLVSGVQHPKRIDNSAGFDFGGVRVSPALTLSAGYDSAPNGAAPGSAVLGASPRVIIADEALGFGIYAGGDFTRMPENASQDFNGGVFAVGEKAALPRETLTLGGVYLATQETGFALTTLSFAKPVFYRLADVRAQDEIALGMLTLTPSVDISALRFNTASQQNRNDYREALRAAFATGGPGTLVMLLRAAQARFSDAALDTDTNGVLLGVEDKANGLWTLRLLAGLAAQHGTASGSTTAPIFEAGVDWMPTDLDRVRLTLAREIDDPDEVSLTPYTLSEAKISLAHEYLRNVDLDVSVDAQQANYLHSALKETLLSTDALIAWRLNAVLALKAEYAFNDRQANFLRAANEHVLTLGLTWTP